MKLKELIEILKSFDAEMEVVFDLGKDDGISDQDFAIKIKRVCSFEDDKNIYIVEDDEVVHKGDERIYSKALVLHSAKKLYGYSVEY